MSDTYIKQKYRGYRLTLLAGFTGENFLSFCCRETLPETPDCRRIHSSAGARVYRFELDGQAFFHKTFLPRGRLEPVKNFLLGNRADRGLRGHRLLLDQGFTAPRVIMTGHKKDHVFMVTAAVPDPVNLYQYLRGLAELEPAGFRRCKRVLIGRVAQCVGRLHARNIMHGDLRWGNLLFSGPQPDAGPIFLIDNERTFRYPVLPAVRRLKNLVQMNMTRMPALTRTDRLRFFNHYLEENPALIPAKKKWIRWIAAKTDRRLKL